MHFLRLPLILVDLVNVVSGFVDLEVNPFLVLYSAQAGTHPLDPTPEAFMVHETAYHDREAHCNNELVDKEKKEEHSVETTTIRFRLRPHRQAH